MNGQQVAPPEQLGTPEQVAEYLQIPEKTLAKWRSDGTGPPYRRLGRHARYDWADVRAWFASGRTA